MVTNTDGMDREKQSKQLMVKDCTLQTGRAEKGASPGGANACCIR